MKVPEFPTYEAYKDSGVEWLGRIPAHWEVRRNMGVFDERNERGQPDDELLSVTIERGVIPQSEIMTKKDSSNEDKSKYKVVRKGDLAYNKMRAWQGALGISPYNGIVSPAYIILRPKNSKLSKYFHYLYRTPQFITEANRLSYGLCDDMNSLRYEHFKESYSPLPPDDEVDRIVAFLDEKTAMIDDLIAKKKRQIELLEEQKAILINRAVTRGILNAEFGMLNEHLSTDANSTFATHHSKFIPSGIDWIGEIPEGWNVVQLKRVAGLQTGITLGKDYPANRSIEIPYLRVANVQSGHLSLESVTTLNVPESIAERHALRKGDVLVAEGGDLDKLGRGCVWNAELDPCIHQNHVFAVRPHPEKLIPEFLSLALGSAYGQRYFTLTGKKTTNLASTNSSLLMSFPLLLPPFGKQKEILWCLRAQLKSIDQPINAVGRQLQALLALRNTLIAHAVIGRVVIKI